MFDCHQAGFERGRNLEKIGLHASDTSELFFQDLKVPDDALLGVINKGFAILMQELPRERLALAACSVAAAEGLLEQTIAYVKELRAFGQAIADFQHTRFALAEIATEIRVNRALIESCKAEFMRRQLDAPTVCMAKLSATEMQGRVADCRLQLYGGYGYMSEYGVSMRVYSAFKSVHLKS